MEIEELKRKIELFKNGNFAFNDNYVSVMTLEKALLNIQTDIREKLYELANFIEKSINEECEIVINNKENKNFDLVFKTKSIDLFLMVENDRSILKPRGLSNLDENKLNKLKDLLSSNERIFVIMSDYAKYKTIDEWYINLETNEQIYMNIYNDLNDIIVHYTDVLSKFSTFDMLTAIGNRQFIYTRNLIDNEDDLYIKDEAKEFLDEELFKKMYEELKVDISLLPDYIKEETKKVESNINDNDLKIIKEKEDIIKMDQVKILKAFKHLEEATSLLKDVNNNFNFHKLKIKYLREIIFKNNGEKNSDGYYEFLDFFKENTLLRMLDLSDLDLRDVDIRGIDFSNTNIHINPQVIYNRDMTDVNCTNVKFSPFMDSFNGVILDGTIINDEEAMIHVDTLKSYNNKTRITKEVINQLGNSR